MSIAPAEITPVEVGGGDVGRRVGRALRANKLMAVGLGIAVVFVVIAVAAPLIAPHPADAGTATHPTQALLGPSADHPFGTDQVGRDILTRVLYGARTSLRIVALVLLLSALIGVPLGIVAGYFGGLVDDVIMRVTDVFLAFPALLLALALASGSRPRGGRGTPAWRAAPRRRSRAAGTSSRRERSGCRRCASSAGTCFRMQRRPCSCRCRSTSAESS
jgi:peptide/nickel transport system permease protein